MKGNEGGPVRPLGMTCLCSLFRDEKHPAQTVRKNHLGCAPQTQTGCCSPRKHYERPVLDTVVLVNGHVGPTTRPWQLEPAWFC